MATRGAAGAAGAAGAGVAPPVAGAVGDPGPGIAAIYRARSRTEGVARRTPLLLSAWLSDALGVPVYLKLECWQATNSFKLRGAYNAVAALDAEDRARGLVTASAGNHGQALALAARLHGASATIFVPADAPSGKQTRILRFGAELRPTEGSYDDAAAAARLFAAEGGGCFVHGFNDPDVVAGQGTVGLEIVEDLPQVRTVVVPVGGGGLVAGVGVAVKTLVGPDARVLGVQSDRTVAMHAAFSAGAVVPTPVVPTLCDGLAGETEPESFERARRVVDSLHLVDEGAIAAAIRALYQEERVVAEGSGAVGVAAALAGLPLDGPTAIVVSGGNIDRQDLSRILADD
jgi:threonine dehydratase